MSDCKCGYGGEAGIGSDFRRGHDSKLRSELERLAGGIFGLERLVRSAKKYSDGKMNEHKFNNLVKKIFTSRSN
jgi:hypothetical protein